MEPPDITPRSVVCRTCGAENRPERLFCAACGAYLQSEEEDTWENLPASAAAPRSASTPPSTHPTPTPPARGGLTRNSRWGEAPRWEPAARGTQSFDLQPEPLLPGGHGGQSRSGKRSPALGVLLGLLLLAAAAVTGSVVYVTFLRAGNESGEVALPTSTLTPGGTTSTSVTPPGGASGSTPTTFTTVQATTLGARVVVVSARASSELAPQGENTYGAENLIDGDPSTCWSEGVAGPGEGEWVRLELPAPTNLVALEVANGYQKDSRRFAGNPRVRRLQVEYSDGTSQTVQLYDDTGFQLITAADTTTDWVRLVIEAVYPGDTWDDTSLSEVRLYRKGD